MRRTDEVEMPGVNMGPWLQNQSSLKYRMGNSTLAVKRPFLVLVTFSLLAFFIYIYASDFRRKREPSTTRLREYNSTYPLSPPIESIGGDVKYRIALIADLDSDSKKENNSWRSYMKKGFLTKSSNGNYDVSFDTGEVEITSKLSYGGRGMELSELVVFNGKLYTCDDRTGVIYSIEGEKVVPWVILSDGNGSESKGFKCEWLTIKDNHMYVGGLGKEWTSPDGEKILNHNPMFIKKIAPSGEVTHINWYEEYVHIRRSSGITTPGYMIHEAVAWSSIHYRWFFLPRRASKEKYNEIEDELKGTNLLLIMENGNRRTKVIRVGGTNVIKNPSHGFSSLKFIPGSQDKHILAIKSEELKGKVATYVTIIDIKGSILLPERKIGNYKFEGVEFV